MLRLFLNPSTSQLCCGFYPELVELAQDDTVAGHCPASLVRDIAVSPALLIPQSTVGATSHLIATEISSAYF